MRTDMKKKVLLVINSNLSFSGVPAVVMTIIRNLSEKYCFDIITLGVETTGDYDKEFREFGGQIFHFTLSPYGDKWAFINRPREIKSQLKEVLNRNHYDIIHCHNGIESGIFLKVAQEYRIPVRVTHAHGTYPRALLKNLLKYFYKEINYNMIPRYSTERLSCSLKSGKSLYGESSFLNVLNPVNVKYFSTIMRKKKQTICLLQIGYFCENKNQLFTLKLISMLLENGIQAEAKFIGYPLDKQYHEKMKNSIYKLQIADHVVFLPKDADKREFLAEASYLVLPSLSEGMPLVTLEAQSGGVPCITSLSVPDECDLGLLKRISVSDVDAWIRCITDNEMDDYSLSENRVNEVDESQYCNRIMSAYERG